MDMGNESVQSLAKILVGKLPSENEQHNANQIRRNARSNFSKGRVASGFARITGSASAGDIAKTAITAERLAGVGQDSQDVLLQRMYGSNKSKPTKAPVENTEFMEREFQPTSKLDKPTRAMNLEETNRLYAKRRRAS